MWKMTNIMWKIKQPYENWQKPFEKWQEPSEKRQNHRTNDKTSIKTIQSNIKHGKKQYAKLQKPYEKY